MTVQVNQGVRNDSSCNLIVNYLPLSYRERHLSKLFSKIGEIKSCRVMRFVQDGRTLSKGYGFVKYHNIENAIQAIQTLNGKNVLGKKIKVSFARPSAQRTRSNLFVSQIPKRWTSEELKEFFAPFGNIIESRVLRTDSGESRRCGFVRFDNDEQAEECMAKLNGRRPTSYDYQIRVRIATQHEKNKPTKSKMNVEKLNKIHNMEAENLALPLQEVLKNSNLSDLASIKAFEQHNDELSTHAASLDAVSVVTEATDKVIEAHNSSNKDVHQSDKNVLFLEPAPELRKLGTSRQFQDDKVFSRRLVLEVPPMRNPRRRNHRDFQDPDYYYHARDDRRTLPSQYNMRNNFDAELQYTPRYVYENDLCRDYDLRYERHGNPYKGDPAYYGHQFPEKPYRQGYDLSYDTYGYGYEPPLRYESSSYGFENQPIRSQQQLSADVHIVNLPLTMNRQDVARLCSACGDIVYMHMPRDPSGRSLGMAFVSFESLDAAKLAVHQLDNSVLGRNQIHVSVVQK